MPEVVWTDKAQANIAAINAYISEYNPLAAQRLAARLLAAGNSLVSSPERGRSISRHRRELVVVTPYLIRYRVRGSMIFILEVRHGARSPR